MLYFPCFSVKMRMGGMRMEQVEILYSELGGQRLDAFLSKSLDTHSRSFLQKMIEDGLVRVNGDPVLKKKHLLRQGDCIQVVIPEIRKMELRPVEMPIDVVYEDDYLLIVNKPAGLVVHPADSHEDVTLVHLLLAHCDHLSGIGGVERPGIVHRLDKETAGLMVVAKEDRTHRALSSMMQEHTIRRTYTAVVSGHLLPDKNHLETFFGRHPVHRSQMAVLRESDRKAVTDYQVQKYYRHFSLVSLQLQTGRTHQIRVHMDHLGTPVVADKVYNSRKAAGRHFLDLKPEIRVAIDALPAHLLVSTSISFLHPIKEESLEFSIELPDYFSEFLQTLEKFDLDSVGGKYR